MNESYAFMKFTLWLFIAGNVQNMYTPKVHNLISGG